MTSTFGFDAAPQAITQRAMSNAFNQEEKARRDEAQLNIDFYFGKQEQSLNLVSDDMLPVVLNLTKPVIGRRTGMLYSRPLLREFEGPAGSIAAIEQIYKDNSIDALLAQADLYSELTGSSLIHPFPDARLEGGVRLRMYDSTQFSCLGEDQDPNTADALDLIRVVDRLIDPHRAPSGRGPEIERVLQHQIWTNDSVVFYEGSQVIGSDPNPYGFLPFVNFVGEPVHDQYIGYPVATLVRKLNAHINQLLSGLGFMVTMQAATPIALSGFSSGESVVVHPGRALSLPAGASAEVLNLNPKIAETLELVKYLEDRLYLSSSVPKVTIEGGDADKTHISGAQLLVRWYPLTVIFREKAVRYQRYELELANVILATLRMPLLNDVKIDWPAEDVLPYSPDEENLERDIRLNLKSPIDELIRRDPRLSEEEAQAELLANQVVNEMNAPAPAPQEEEVLDGAAA